MGKKSGVGILAAGEQIGVVPEALFEVIGDRDGVFIAREQSDVVAGADLALFDDSEVEPRASALEKPLHHVGAIEANRQLDARHSRLGDDELGAADAKTVADADVALDEAVGGEILAEGAPRQRKVAELLAPVRVMLRWIDVDRLVDAAVDGEVGLLVAGEIVPNDADAAVDR